MDGNNKNKCEKCGWYQNCSGTLKEKCEEYDYDFFISEYDKKMCDMICNNIED